MCGQSGIAGSQFQRTPQEYIYKLFAVKTIFFIKRWERGLLNPNSVICTTQLLDFNALNPGSALNPRTLNPGTTVLLLVYP